MSFVTEVISHMYNYQKENNVVKCCIDNSIYLCDILNGNGIKAKVKAVIMTTIENEELCVIGGHLVVDIGNGRLLDASYETNFKPNQNYFDKLKDLLISYPMLKPQNEFIASIMKLYIHFNKIADKINNEGVCLVTNETHYHKQADYVEMMVQRH